MPFFSLLKNSLVKKFLIVKGAVMEDNKIRLQKFLASSGVASRRKCEELILEGKVSVNGTVVTELGTKINPDVDKVTYCGKLVQNKEKMVYILLSQLVMLQQQKTNSIEIQF